MKINKFQIGIGTCLLILFGVSHIWAPRRCNGRVVSPFFEKETQVTLQKIGEGNFYGYDDRKRHWINDYAYFRKDIYAEDSFFERLAVNMNKKVQKNSVYMAVIKNGHIQACAWNFVKD